MTRVRPWRAKVEALVLGAPIVTVRLFDLPKAVIADALADSSLPV